MKINSHNEWDTLQEIIVGRADRSKAVLTWTKPNPPDQKVLEEATKLSGEAFPQWFLDEINEDISGICSAVSQFGAKVYRPEVFDINRMVSSPDWSTTGNNIYNVRDLNLVVGNTLIESPSPVRSRYFESTALYPIFYRYFEEGFRWVCGPKPRLKGDILTPYFSDDNARELGPEEIKYETLTNGRMEKLHRLCETEILFEAANTLRMGRDLLYLVSSSGNRLGARWLQSVLGDEYRVHTTDKIYRASHIDSSLLCLAPGKVLVNSARVTAMNCPKIFEKWDKIWFEDVAPTSDIELNFQKEVREPIARRLNELGFETNLEEMASPWVGMNVLSLDPKTVLADARQAKLIHCLENQGFCVVPVKMRHIYTQGGGIHCATLDTRRKSKLENYFD